MRKGCCLVAHVLLASLLSIPIRAQEFFKLESRAAEGESLAETPEGILERIVDVRFNRGGTVALTAEFGSVDAPATEGPRRGVFLQNEGAARLVADLSALESEDTFFSFLYHFSLNDRGTVAVASYPSGVFLLPRLGPVFRVSLGDPAPVQPIGTIFSGFLTPSSDFLGQEDEAVFLALLSDGRYGLFGLSSSGVRVVALTGDPVPDRPKSVFGDISLFSVRAVGGRIAFVAGGDVFVDDETGVHTVVSAGQPLPNGEVFSGASAIDVNLAGEVVVASYPGGSPRLTLFGDFAPTPVLDGPGPLEGFQDETFRLSDSLYLDDSRQVYFAVTNERHGGIFGWRQGVVSKIVADGDPSPTGGVLEVSVDYSFLPGPPPFRFTSFLRPNALGDVAFEAWDSVIGDRPFRWRDGSIEPVDFQPDIEADRLLLSLRPFGLDAQGNILAIGNRCCGAFSKAIYEATPTASRRLVLPYVAAGGSREGLRISTQVELSNRSRDAAEIRLSSFSFSTPIPLFNPLAEGPFLEPGGFARIASRSEGPSGSGFAIVESQGKGFVNANALIRLERGGSLISQISLTTRQPVLSGRLFVDQGGAADTGVAVSNPFSAPVDLEASLSDESGFQVGQKTLHLEGGQQISKFVSELFPQRAPAGFLGSLEIRSLGEDRFLAAGLRQSQLSLSSLPLGTKSSPPRHGLGGFSADQALQILNNDNGTLAVNDGSAIQLVSREASFRALDENSALPGGIRQAGIPQVRLVDFDAGMDLLFTLTTVDNQVALLRWRAGDFQRLLVSGDEVEGYTVEIPLESDAYSRNEDGVIAAGGKQVVVFDPGPRLLVTSDSRIGTSNPDTWGAFRQVHVGPAGEVYFMTDRGIGRAEGSRIEVIAQTGGLLEGTNVRPERFLRLLPEPNGDLLVAVSSRIGLLSPSSIVRFSGGSFVTVLSPNMPIQGLPGFGVSQIDTEDFQVNSKGEVLANAVAYEVAGTRFVIVFVMAPRHGQPQLFALGTDDGLPGFPEGEAFHFSNSFGDPFQWSDDGRLLFRALDRHGQITAFLAGPERVVSLITPGDVFSRSPDGQTLQVALVGSVVGFGLDGDPLVNARYQDGEGAERFLLEAFGTDGQDRFLPIAASVDIAGTRFESRVLLANRGQEQSAVELTPTTWDGRTLAALEMSLDPGQVRSVDLGIERGFRGWIRVRTRGGNVAAQERLTIYEGPSLVAEATVPGSGLRTRGEIDTRFTTSSRIGLAIANPGNAPVAVHFVLDTGDPETSRSQRITLDGRTQRSLFVSEIFPPIPVSGAAPGEPGSPADGILRMVTEAPVAMIALRQEGLVLTTQQID